MPSSTLKKIIFVLSLILFLGGAGMVVYAILLGPDADTGGYWFEFGGIVIEFVIAMLGLAGLSFTYWAKKTASEGEQDRQQSITTGDVTGDIIGRDKVEGDQYNVQGDMLKNRVDHVAAGGIVVQGTDNVINVNVRKELTVEEREALWEQFAQMPLDHVPERQPVPAGFFNMPYNDHFVGRQSELITIAKRLAGRENKTGVAIAATGMGGIGKTQLAAEFCHRYGRYFGGGVFWVDCESEETLRTDLALIALSLHEASKDADIESQIQWVIKDPQGWSANIPRLVIYDNLEDPKLLAKYKPTGPGARLILTSRLGRWEHTGISGIEPLTLGLLKREESIALLQGLAAQLSENEADGIAQELGDLPLALHVAGAYLKEFADVVDANAYLNELQAFSVISQLGKQSADIEGEEVINPTAHSWHIGRTFRISYDQLLETEGACTTQTGQIKWIARRLLTRVALLAPGISVPTKLLFATFDSQEEEKPEAANGNAEDNAAIEPSPKNLQQGLNRLMRLGLVEMGTFDAGNGIIIHRLLADFVQRGGDEDRADLATVERELTFTCNRLNNTGYPRNMLSYHPHLYHLLDKAKGRRDAQTAEMINTLGVNLRGLGDLPRAKLYLEQALEISSEELGEKHPYTAASLNNLGLLLKDMGDLSEAKPYLEQALAIYREVFGGTHSRYVLSLNNLGGLLQDMGDLSGAKPYYEQALSILEEKLGPDHPTTNIVRGNLESLE